MTDIITKEWSGFTTREYKEFKGLKENLRDHMTNLETALNTLAKAGGKVALFAGYPYDLIKTDKYICAWSSTVIPAI